ncbi:hypothetical protein QR680_008916 [Steinernema hermaphroditum]|uniref:Costars domain-containing protein n=1 Tax=Steinernema hermaphroditum TaxID=289476 RepID=A0AA39IK96_9BILA|nr:hypothetical protein QR680_008916 [Steinernema hermaphroditum]
MISKRTFPSRTVVITVTVATVKGHCPLVGFSEEVEKRWRALKKKHKMREKRKNGAKLPRANSASDILEEKKEGPQRSSTVSSVQSLMSKFKQIEADSIAESRHDVYSTNYIPKKYSKMSPEYGRPKPGTLTEKRAQKASKHIEREMVQVCEVILEYGRVSKRTGKVVITFGELFRIYQFISDKVVGMLLRARKHQMVDFEGEMLFQRRDEEVVISLLWTPEQIATSLAK